MTPEITLFGCPFDCDEKHDAVVEKQTGAGMNRMNDDPLEAVADILRTLVPEERWHRGGVIEVPPWLRPQPPADAMPQVDTAAFVAFIDRDGCRDMAARVEHFVRDTILPGIPCMVAVDHCLTGGVIRALAAHYGKENLTTVVLDSHTDAVPMSVLSAAVQYDIDTNPDSPHFKDDPFLYNRTESYNASSFIHHLLEEQVILPGNLMILGASDLPQKRAARIKDRRIADYVDVFGRLKRKGVKLVGKKDCQTKPTKVKNLFRQIKTPYVYVSIDMDIGSRNAVEAVRFRDWKGLSANQIYGLAAALTGRLGKGLELVGMDVTEFNARRAGQPGAAGFDQTYEIAAELIKRIAFHGK
jgi:arginase family enzyme